MKMLVVKIKKEVIYSVNDLNFNIFTKFESIFYLENNCYIYKNK